jgi:hypothetical protein
MLTRCRVTMEAVCLPEVLVSFYESTQLATQTNSVVIWAAVTTSHRHISLFVTRIRFQTYVTHNANVTVSNVITCSLHTAHTEWIHYQGVVPRVTSVILLQWLGLTSSMLRTVFLGKRKPIFLFWHIWCLITAAKFFFLPWHFKSIMHGFNYVSVSEMSGSHGGEHEDESILGYRAI